MVRTRHHLNVGFIVILICLSFAYKIDGRKGGLISSASPTSSLFMKRTTYELQELERDKLSLRIPFNLTNDKNENNLDECGIRISPVNNKLLEWHFTFTGVKGSPYEGGLYHGIIKLGKDYPRKPPSVCLHTPSGRWAVGKEICLSASSYHPESWSSSWNLRTLVLSLRAFMTTAPQEIGGIQCSLQERKELALSSRYWKCAHCGVDHKKLLSISTATTERSLEHMPHVGSSSDSSSDRIDNISVATAPIEDDLVDILVLTEKKTENINERAANDDGNGSRINSNRKSHRDRKQFWGFSRFRWRRYKRNKAIPRTVTRSGGSIRISSSSSSVTDDERTIAISSDDDDANNEDNIYASDIDNYEVGRESPEDAGDATPLVGKQQKTRRFNRESKSVDNVTWKTGKFLLKSARFSLWTVPKCVLSVAIKSIKFISRM